MSFNLKEAFKTILNMQKVPATIERNGEIAVANIFIAPSNYFRDFNSVEEVPIRGNEFVIDKDDIDATGTYTAPERGDFIASTLYGETSIDEVRPMVIMGTLVGWRVRTTK